MGVAPATEGRAWATVLDQDRCIGCDACTVACRTENQVPLGITRTYVKSVEVGRFPQPRRQLQVNRCNQCQDAPCVAICPTGAIVRREDGIVDIDRRACIGCGACIAACPYDAISLDPQDHVADKCNLCAHRLDSGLEPACVSACPVDAILVGDLNDVAGPLARIVQRGSVTVRRPEKGTLPRVFYRGAGQATLDPIAVSTSEGRNFVPATQRSAGRNPSVAWDWRVALAAWGRSIACGAYPAALLAVFMTGGWAEAFWGWFAPIVALGGLLLAGISLLAHLKRPLRFHILLLRPHWGSWITRSVGAAAVYGALLAAHLGLTGLGVPVGWWLGVPIAVAAIVAAAAAALALPQAAARDLWQSPLVLPQALTQATIAGAAVMLLLALAFPAAILPLGAIVATSCAAHLLLAAGEVGLPRPTAHATLAVRELTRGRGSRLFWLGNLAVLIGLAAPLVPPLAVFPLAGVLACQLAQLEAGQAVALA